MTDVPLRIACFGDSLTEGYGLPPEEALPSVFERLLKEQGLPVQCLNFGISGETFGDGLLRVENVLQSRPDAVILAFGANDCVLDDSIQDIRQNAEALITRLTSQQVPILLAGITARPEIGAMNKSEFDPLFQELAKAYGLLLFPDILAPYYPDPSLTLLDGLHPNAQGVEAMARAMLPQAIELVQAVKKKD